jgi:hypothetical protein
MLIQAVEQSNDQPPRAPSRGRMEEGRNTGLKGQEGIPFAGEYRHGIDHHSKERVRHALGPGHE